MYSPNIHPSLIPILYRLGQHQQKPMTQLTDQLLLEALERTQLPLPCQDMLESAKRVLRPSEPIQEAA
jgi:hypothetical protein